MSSSRRLEEIGDSAGGCAGADQRRHAGSRQRRASALARHQRAAADGREHDELRQEKSSFTADAAKLIHVCIKATNRHAGRHGAPSGQAG
eukprot:1842659-Prymnesium_polylepis.1